MRMNNEKKERIKQSAFDGRYTHANCCCSLRNRDGNKCQTKHGTRPVCCILMPKIFKFKCNYAATVWLQIKCTHRRRWRRPCVLGRNDAAAQAEDTDLPTMYESFVTIFTCANGASARTSTRIMTRSDALERRPRGMSRDQQKKTLCNCILSFDCCIWL